MEKKIVARAKLMTEESRKKLEKLEALREKKRKNIEAQTSGTKTSQLKPQAASQIAISQKPQHVVLLDKGKDSEVMPESIDLHVPDSEPLIKKAKNSSSTHPE